LVSRKRDQYAKAGVFYSNKRIVAKLFFSLTKGLADDSYTSLNFGKVL